MTSSDEWRTEGSAFMGRRIVRSVFDSEGVVIGRTEGLVVGWLDAHESDYVHSVTGKPAPLWR